MFLVFCFIKTENQKQKRKKIKWLSNSALNKKLKIENQIDINRVIVINL